MELRALQEISQLIGTAVELDATFSHILTVLHRSLKMERASLLLLDKTRQKLAIRASCGLSVTAQTSGAYRPDEGICDHIFQRCSPFVMADSNAEPLFLNRTGARTGISRSSVGFLGAPVIVQGEPAGILTVDRLFGDDISLTEDLRFLSVVAALLAQFITLHRQIEKKEATLIKENLGLKAKLRHIHGGHFIIGHSKPMQAVFSIIEKAGAGSATALLLGESGTGKELVARAIHCSGSSKEAPFIKINCAALPEPFLERELFGHEKDGFTSARAAKPGRLELAAGGTILLDEIGAMPWSVQAKTLRVLQEQQAARINGTKTYPVDVRIVAATSVSLETAVNHGEFSADLYYRLNVVPIILPPLRERTDDIPLLFNHFLQKSNERNGRHIKLSPNLLDFLVSYSWPGNVREMQNMVERMVILAEGNRLTLVDLPSNISGAVKPPPKTPTPPDGAYPPLTRTPSFSQARPQQLHEIEKQEVEAALRRNGWVQVRAARELGLSQRQIGYRIKKYGLNPCQAEHRHGK